MNKILKINIVTLLLSYVYSFNIIIIFVICMRVYLRCVITMKFACLLWNNILYFCVLYLLMHFCCNWLIVCGH